MSPRIWTSLFIFLVLMIIDEDCLHVYVHVPRKMFLFISIPHIKANLPCLILNLVWYSDLVDRLCNGIFVSYNAQLISNLMPR